MSLEASRVITTSEDGVATVEMRDQADANALGAEMVVELTAALREVSEDTSTKVVVLFGLPDVFCSGAPERLLVALARGEVDPTEIALAAALLDVAVPTIAGMEGHAVGGGLALGFCADVVVLAEESRYGATFMNYGFTPGMGTTRLLEHALSPAVAHELLFTGELRRGRDFAGRSGVNHVVAKRDVRRVSLDVARRIADKPRHALELLKATLAAPRRAAFASASAEEARLHQISFAQPETLARIKREFLGANPNDIEGR